VKILQLPSRKKERNLVRPRAPQRTILSPPHRCCELLAAIILSIFLTTLCRAQDSRLEISVTVETSNSNQRTHVVVVAVLTPSGNHMILTCDPQYDSCVMPLSAETGKLHLGGNNFLYKGPNALVFWKTDRPDHLACYALTSTY
jgi:hypothetical protein